MTAARRRGRPRDPAADAAILQAGLDLFVERGIEGASMEQIAKRAGVGKLTVYRRWPAKEALIAQAIETLVTGELSWPADEVIDRIPPHQLVEAALSTAAETAAAPGFRALVARLLGSSVTHPSLMATYWEHYVAPRRALAARLLERARGGLAADPAAGPNRMVDLDVLIDMLVGAVLYRVLQPDPPDQAEMRRYLAGLYRQAGLLM